MKKIVLGIVGLFAIALSSVSLAGGPDILAPISVGPAAAPGVYITAGLGYGETDWPDNIGFIDFDEFKADHTDLAWFAALGYQFNANLAIEAGYIRAANLVYKDTLPSGEPGGVAATLHPHIVYAAIKGILPLDQNQRADLFAKAGLGYSTISLTVPNQLATIVYDDHNLVPVLAIGGDYYLTNNLAITVQGLMTLHSGSFPNTFMATGGLTYKILV